MARDITASAIIARAREQADMVTSSASTAFVTDTEALAQLNLLVGIWHGLLVKAVPERFEETEEFDATGADYYDLPVDHYLTLGVDYKVSATTWWPLDRVQYQDRTRFETTGTPAEGYYLKAATLVLVPAPSSGTYRHVYVTAAPTLLSGTSIDGVNGWESWLVYGLAAFMARKEESLEAEAGLLAQQARVQGEIEAASQDREASKPMRIVDTRLRRY